MIRSTREKLRQIPIFQKPTCIDTDEWRKEEWSRDSEKFFAEYDVFKDRLVGKPSESFEQCTSDKPGLVAVDDPVAGATEIIEQRDQLELPTIAREPVHEPTSLDGLVHLHLV